MLDEEIQQSAIAICNGKGVPENLLRYYIETGGLSKETNNAEKRFYDSTIIPEAKDFMVNLNNFFKTQEHGIELLGSYDHLNVLQANKKDEAQTKKFNIEAAEKAFKMGAVDYNFVLACLGLPNDATIGSKRVWDLTPEELNAIGINNKKENINEDTD